MPEDPPPQRFLIATGVTVGLPKTGGRVEDSVGRMAEIFQGTFRYERVNTLGLNPTAEQMRRELRHFALKCGPRDFVAFYHTGHATEEGGKHRLWMADTGDVVAAVEDLRPLFGSGIRQLRVHNGAKAHDMTSYLTDPRTGELILAGLHA